LKLFRVIVYVVNYIYKSLIRGSASLSAAGSSSFSAVAVALLSWPVVRDEAEGPAEAGPVPVAEGQCRMHSFDEARVLRQRSRLRV
jgi:hypothetical protein